MDLASGLISKLVCQDGEQEFGCLAHYLVKCALTCAITPGLMGKGWIAGACVTRGMVFSIRTEYPAG